MLISDRLGNLIRTGTYSSIISLVPSWSEFICKLDLLDHLHGRTDYCILPHRIRAVPNLGGTKNPDVGQIIEINPDIIIANKEENKQFDINRLRAAGITVFMTGAVTVIEALEEMENIEYLLKQDVEVTRSVRRNLKHFKTVEFSFIYLVWKGPLIAAGSNTYINNILQLVGGTNKIEGSQERYPKISVKQLKDLQPDVILLPDEPYEFDVEDKKELSQILPSSQVILLDGKLCSWYGTRIKDAVERLPEIISSNLISMN